MRERYVLRSNKGYLKPIDERLGSGITYTDVPAEASKFVTVEVACAIAKEICLEEHIAIEPILV